MLAIGEVGCGKQEHRGASDFSMIVVIMNEKNGLFTDAMRFDDNRKVSL